MTFARDRVLWAPLLHQPDPCSQPGPNDPEAAVRTLTVCSTEQVGDHARDGSLRRSLLLNASREPLCVVSVHRAVTLVLSGKAVVLESDGRMLRSPSLAVPVPQVLCLTRYVHVPYRRAVPPSRRMVLHRDGHRCAYCAGPADTVDHVHPRSRGGVHDWTNVVAACSRCNHRKADRLLSELGWQLLITPTVPRGPAAVLAAAVRPHPSWQAYLAA